MTFKFTATGKTKDAAATAADEALAKATQGQREHDHDRARVGIAVRAMVRALEEPGEGQRLAIVCTGNAALQESTPSKEAKTPPPLYSEVFISVAIEADPEDAQVGEEQPSSEEAAAP